MGKYARALKRRQEDQLLADLLGITLDQLEARRKGLRQLIDTPHLPEPAVMVVSPRFKAYLVAHARDETPPKGKK